MTGEQLMEANNIMHELKDVEAKMEIIADMQEGHHAVKLYNSEIGSVQLTLEVADEVCGIVLNSLIHKAEELRKEFQEL